MTILRSPSSESYYGFCPRRGIFPVALLRREILFPPRSFLEDLAQFFFFCMEKGSHTPAPPSSLGPSMGHSPPPPFDFTFKNRADRFFS